SIYYVLICFASLMLFRSVLLIHGRDDRHVPVAQSQGMIAALKRAGRPPRSLLLNHEGHTFADEASRRQVFTAIVDFLAEHLGVPDRKSTRLNSSHVKTSY